MSLRITLDIFSGRPNPVIELSGQDARDALARLKPARKLKADEIQPIPDSYLGYRGLVIEQVGDLAGGLPRRVRFANGDVFGKGLSHRAEDADLEEFLASSKAFGKKLPAGILGVLESEVERLGMIRSQASRRRHRRPVSKRCECAPLYEPLWWNDAGQKQFNNNCYNYACNYRSDTFAQPGQAAGAIYAGLTCADVRPAALRDDLIDAPGANNRCPKEGHLVALVIAPGIDFHWYRKGRNGLWTHKPGGTAVTNVDNAGAPIADPRTADRGMYTDFCTFMVVMHGHVKIQ
jgi:hypothetical protein